MNPTDIHVIIRYRAQPGQAETALRELAALVAVVRREERDCTGIIIVQRDEDPCDFTLLETWTSREAYAGPAPADAAHPGLQGARGRVHGRGAGDHLLARGLPRLNGDAPSEEHGPGCLAAAGPVAVVRQCRMPYFSSTMRCSPSKLPEVSL